MKSGHEVYERDGMYWCKLCDHDEDDVCGAKRAGYSCTREPGHEGDHAACGSRWPDPDHTHAVWPRA